jgi:hypothetical protein
MSQHHVDQPSSPFALIRAGANSLEPTHVRRQALASLELLGLMGISMLAVWPGEVIPEVWAQLDPLRNRSAIWVSTPQALVEAGFRVVQTGKDARHFTVCLPSLDDDSLAMIAAVMTRVDR